MLQCVSQAAESVCLFAVTLVGDWRKDGLEEDGLEDWRRIGGLEARWRSD